LPLEKPPFSATPGGQKLSPGVPVTDNIKTVGTGKNPYAGAAGNVRNQGDKRHTGIDEKANEARYTGVGPGNVTSVVNDKRLGGIVKIEQTAPDGSKWEKTIMHLDKVNVKVGDTVKNGDKVGEGQGKGEIFKEKNASEPHIHTEIRHNGRPVEPYSGRELAPNPSADVKERERAADRARKEAEAAQKEVEKLKSDGSKTEKQKSQTPTATPKKGAEKLMEH